MIGAGVGLTHVPDRGGIGVDLGVHELHVGMLGACSTSRSSTGPHNAGLAVRGRRDEHATGFPVLSAVVSVWV